MKQNLHKARIFELIDSMARSWWTVVAGLCLGLAASYAVLHYTSPIYQSTTKIYVAPQKIPAGYIQSTVTDDIAVRLRSLQEEVLSRPYMLKLIEAEFALPEEDEELALLINNIRSRVEIVSSRTGRYFELMYRDTDPVRAANVVNTLADHYIEENARFRVTRAGETTETLELLAREALEKLQAKERLISEFKAHHLYTIADQMPANLEMLNSRRSALDLNETALETARVRLRDVEAEYERQKALNPDLAPTDPYAARVVELEEQLAALRIRYSSDHPDVQNKIRELGSAREDAARLSPPPPEPGDTADTVPAEIVSLRRQIARLETGQVKIEQEIKTYEWRIDETPKVQQQLEDLTKGHDILAAKYNEYQGKVESARGALKMEEAQQGSRFEVIEKAVAPVLPISPNPKRVLVTYLAAALALFVGPILVKGLLKPLVVSEAGLAYHPEVTLLVSIPKLRTPKNIRQARMRWVKNVSFSAVSAAVLTATIVILG